MSNMPFNVRLFTGTESSGFVFRAQEMHHNQVGHLKDRINTGTPLPLSCFSTVHCRYYFVELTPCDNSILLQLNVSVC